MKKWETDIGGRVNSVRKSLQSNPDKDVIRYVLGPPKPTGSYPVPGLGRIADWDALRGSSAWEALMEDHGKELVGTPTTLDRRDLCIARSLILRGYLNTYLLTLFLAPLNPGDLGRLEDLEHRVDEIVGLR